MTRRFRRRPFLPLLLVVSFLAIIVLRWFQESRQQRDPESLAAGRIEIARVIDGDTLRLTNGARIRLIGVDTPELNLHSDPPAGPEPWAREATEFTRDLLAQGEARLEFDLERKDRFDRFLGYLWIDTAGQGESIMLNEALLRAGMARARLEFHFSDSKKRLFRKAEAEAKAEKRGIWSDESPGD